jgi:hypothetical protein
VPAYQTASSITTNGIIWYQWHQEATGGTMTTANQTCTQQIWADWCVSASNVQVQGAWIDPDAVAAAAKRQKEEQKRLADAKKQAEELLFLFLTPEQREQYKKQGYFETEINDSRYRIHAGRAGNIRKLDKNGKPSVQYCVHPNDWLPDADNVLAQFLALHHDEAALLRTANATPLT